MFLDRYEPESFKV
jgi:transposase-like protein